MMRTTPTSELAVRLLRERFLGRRDQVAVLAPWGKPCPTSPGDSLDALLRAHVCGHAAPPVAVTFDTRRRGRSAERGRFRVGSYAPDLEGRAKWLCLDFDGAGHSHALVDPVGAARAAQRAFDDAGLPSYLERSGGGNGWHLWCFFDPPIPAADAIRIGRLLVPRDCKLVDGGVADVDRGAGIELFPKQPTIARGGFGNMVWLPWWSAAKTAGANLFYRCDEDDPDGPLVPYAPEEIVVVPKDAIAAVLPLAAEQPVRERARRPPHRTAAASPGPASTAWQDWRSRALAALPLESVYGPWLTGASSGRGWLTSRDPASPSGDMTPSAGVADGSGEAERGTFHAFRSATTLSVFDFLVQHGDCLDFRAACARVAGLSGVALPVLEAPADWCTGDLGPAEGPAATREPAVSTARRPKPRIIIRTEEHAVVDEAIAALARVEGVYCRGPLLVHVVRDASKLAGIIHPGAAARIVPLGVAGIRDRLTLAADWISIKVKERGIEEVPAHPPGWASPSIEARKSWPKMRCLEGIVESPVLRPDGSLLEQRGYDDVTGLLCLPNAQYPTAPAAPTKHDAALAATELLDVVCDFPFKADAHRAAWVAGVLTPLARYAFRGPAPMFLMDANIRSAGKTLLADVTGEIVSGRAMPRTPQAMDENEEIKRVTAIAIEGDRLVLLDNINRPLGSGALDAVLTGTAWNERILGKSEKVNLTIMTVWYGTGNNVTFKGDTARRCLHIRLDSDLEKPETREGFKHPELLAWVHENRPRLLMAALTMLRAYCEAGKPVMGFKPWGSFEGWSGLVRSAVVFAGLADPGDTRAELDQADTDSNALVDLIAGWADLPNGLGMRGCTIAQALNALRDDPEERRYTRLRSALGELCPHPPGQLPAARKVGYTLRRFRGRVVGGRKLQTRVLDGNNLWFVQQVVSQCGEPGTMLELPLSSPPAEDVPAISTWLER